MASAATEVGGEKRGVMAAAAIVFFAFYGFDAVATSAEEAKNPGRDLTIGIVGSMLVCTIIYMLVAVAAIGALPFQQLANSPEPLALVLRSLGQPLRRLADRAGGGHRAAVGHPGDDVRAEPHLLRHGARRPAAARARQGVAAQPARRR